MEKKVLSSLFLIFAVVLQARAQAIITQQPQSDTVQVGQPASFTVGVAAGGPYLYQWYKNGALITGPGTGAATYTIRAAALTDAAAYFVIVSKFTGGPGGFRIQRDTSAIANLVVVQSPSITVQPVSQTMYLGGSVVFTVSATGSPLSYQWQKDGTDIPGATSSALAIDNIGYGSPGSYTVIVSNAAGSVTSNKATLTVVGIVFQNDLRDTSVNAGSSITLSVTAWGAAPMTYQWQRFIAGFPGGPAAWRNIAGATLSSYTVTAAALADTGMYRVIAANAYARDTSSTGRLTVIGQKPTITQQPVSISAAVGTMAQFSVAASGTAPLAYQWYKNGARIRGAVSPLYTIASVQLADSGYYSVTVTNGFGRDSSAAAVLRVGQKPNITTDPLSVAVVQGNPAMFTATVSGSAPITFQWQRNRADIAGATNLYYIITSAQTSDSGAAFRLIATNPFGKDTSAEAVLYVTGNPAQQKPVIVQQPSPLTVLVGQTATFIVTASTGGGMISFQWQKNGVNIAGADTTGYTIPAAALSDSGNYTVVVSNSAGSVASNPAHLTVVQRPLITSQPSSRTAMVGDTVLFSVTAGGTGLLTYQWQKNGAVIAGATSPTYLKAGVALGDSGNYRVIVSNNWGSDTSQAAFLTVKPKPVSGSKPVITTQPASQAVVVGARAAFSVTATSSDTLIYQWQKNGAPIAGANASSYAIGSASPTDSGRYRVIVSNRYGADTSLQASLTVFIRPQITIDPASRTVQVGDSVSFTVVAIGTGPLSYAWQKFGLTLGGATAAHYLIAPVAMYDSGFYRAIVSNQWGSDTSVAAKLTVVPSSGSGTPPVITAQPSPDTAVTGIAASFSVIASGAAPLSYQWQKNGVSLVNATSAFFSLAAVSAADSGVYRAIVSNGYGADTSRGAPLVIVDKPVITRQPSSVTAIVGDSVIFTVAAKGTTPLSYQWQKNGLPIPGATNAMYRIPAAALSDSGVFRAAVSNNWGSDSSSAARLSVLPKSSVGNLPIITVNPASITVQAGDTASFSVSVLSADPVTYQWQKNGLALVGDSLRNLVIPTATGADSGLYRVIASNRYGADTSEAATLTVENGTVTIVKPKIVLQPVSNTAARLGDTVVFKVSATGTRPLAYRWIKNGATLSGAADSVYTIKGVAYGDTGSYRVIVTNSAGSDTSAAARCALASAPSLGRQAGINAYWSENPVSSSRGATLTYQVPDSGEVSLHILDLIGDLVVQLVPKNTRVVPGSFSVVWRGVNSANRFAGAGAYVYVFYFKNGATGKVTVIRKPVFLVK
ncbi:MAG TPA: immunoglobulin domain-containing protein [Chitinivibrionales bacterium]|nr:immunoglobulin domain-containing protein [Chitinivibrionales bacterium]